MNPELLLLSSRIAVLVLAASLLAFLLAWWWQSLRAQSALRSLTPVREPGVDQQLNELRTALAATEEQCAKALEQRDEAEREAIACRNEVRRLTDQITSLHATMVPREELERVQQQLTQKEAPASTQARRAAPSKERDLVLEEPERERSNAVDIDELRLPLEDARTAPLTSSRLTAQPLLTSTEELCDELFKESDMASLPPDQSNLEDVQDVLGRMEQELEEKEQMRMAVLREHEQRLRSLADLRLESPEAQDLIKAAEKRVGEVEKRLAEATEERDRAHRHVRAVRRSLEVAASQPLRPDNLMRIKGVKSVINSQLHAYGVFSYRQIVAWDEEDLQAFSELLSFKQSIWRNRWQEQARVLHEERYGERLA